jgi:hypothetical protein
MKTEITREKSPLYPPDGLGKPCRKRQFGLQTSDDEIGEGNDKVHKNRSER